VPKIFYPKLFEIDPSTEPLFHENAIEEQGAKLMKTLTMTVRGLDDLNALVEEGLVCRPPGLDCRSRRFDRREWSTCSNVGIYESFRAQLWSRCSIRQMIQSDGSFDARKKKR
jgi:hypothetical protein